MALSGDDLNLSSKSVWDKYHPTCEDISWANFYYIKVFTRCPPDSRCSTADLRRFKWVGVDLIIGWGEPSYGDKSYFLETKESVVIDGYHNGLCETIDGHSANFKSTMELDVWWKNESQAIKSELNTDMYIDYNGRKKLTWGLVKKILGDGGRIFVRSWMRTRGISDSNPHSTAGYLYAGYDDFNNPGQKGHTFNGGLLLRIPRASVSYVNHRTNDYVDGGNYRKYPAIYEIKYDPYMTVWRAPESGTISSHGGKCTYKKRMKVSYKTKIRLYAAGDWNDGSLGSGNGVLIHEEIIDTTQIDNPSGTWAPWSKRITINTGDVVNEGYKHEGKRLFTRIETWQRGDSWTAGEWHGPCDYGFSTFGWYRCIERKVSSGSYYNDTIYAAIADFTNNRYPYTASSVRVSTPPRNNGTLQPGTNITFNSNITEPDGDPTVKILKIRSKQVLDSTTHYDAKDIQIGRVETDQANLDMTINTNDILTKFEGVFGRPADRYVLGYEYGVYDRFNDNGKLESDWKWSGAGWTGYILEYPVNNLRVAVTNATSVHNATVSGQACVVMRNINAEIFYDTPRGDNGMHHALEVNKHVPGAADRSGSAFIIGTWYPESEWQNRLKLPATRKASTDIYALFGSNNANRGCFYKFFTCTTSPGGWSVDKGWNVGNDRSAVVFLNKFPRCVMNSLNYNNGGTEVTADMNFTVTDSFFNLKTVHVDLVIPSLGRAIRVYEENVQSQNIKTFSKTISCNMSKIMRDNGIDPNTLIGQSIEFHSHGENIYDFSQTWDGTRVGAGEWSKSMIYDRNPITGLSVNRRKGEDVVINISKDTTYTKRVRVAVSVKKVGEPDSALKLIKDLTVVPYSFTWNPSSNYPVSLRGSDFEFKYRLVTDYGLDWSNIMNDSRFFQWNEVPTIQMPSLGFGKDNTSGNSVNQINGRWGERVTTYTKCMDPDQKNVDYSIRYNNKDTRVAHYDNIGQNTVDHNSTVSAQQLDDEYKRVNGSYLYPINLDLDMFSIAQCNDPYGQYSPAISSGGFKLLSTERRNAYGYSATSESQKVGDIVYGLSIILQFNMTIINSAKFTSTSYRRRHFICAREVGTSTEFWVFSTEEYPTKTNEECWYVGTDNPGTVKIRVAVGNNGDRFKPGKQYEFRVYTTVQKRGDDSTKLYENNSGWFGKFMYGTYPDKATVLYPNSTQQPMRNPPIIIQIPAQSNVSNSEISDIGVFVNDTWMGWNHADNNNWVANPQTNYANKTIVFNWNNGLGRGQVVNLKFRIKSKLTGLVADTPNYPVNINSNSYIKTQGNIVDGLTDAKDGINALRRAYGMANYSYPSTANGVPITFANHLQCIETAFNEWAAKVRGYGTPAANLSISNGVFILAQSTTTIHNQITEFKK